MIQQPARLESRSLWRGRPKGAITLVPFAHVPFVPRRLFWVTEFTRVGEHASREADEAIFAPVGRVIVELRRPDQTLSFDVGGTVGVFVPAGWWITARRLSREATLLCLASGDYDPEDAIHDWNTYESWARSRMG